MQSFRRIWVLTGEKVPGEDWSEGSDCSIIMLMVVQWLRIYLAVQRTWVPSLFGEGSTGSESISCSSEDMGSIPVWGTKIPHATGQASPCNTTRESAPQKQKIAHIQWRRCVLQLRPNTAKERNNKKAKVRLEIQLGDQGPSGLTGGHAVWAPVLGEEEFWGPTTDWRKMKGKGLTPREETTLEKHDRWGEQRHGPVPPGETWAWGESSVSCSFLWTEWLCFPKLLSWNPNSKLIFGGEVFGR